MIINPIVCEGCGKELQPEMLGVRTNEKDELVRVCGYCGKEDIIK